MNVLDTLGLIAASFGQWWGEEGGEHAELMDAENFKYLRLEFKGDVNRPQPGADATCRGIARPDTDARSPGRVEASAAKDPTRIMEAYLASAQAALV